MSELTFTDDLPGRPPGAAPLSAERAASIKAASPKWARWPSSTARTGVQKTLDAFGPGYEAVNRKLEDGSTAVFVRYVTEPDAFRPAKDNGHGAAVVVADKVKCPACAAFINRQEGEANSAVLARHERTNVICKAANRNRR